MIGDRYDDRLVTTYHRSESMMNKWFGEVGDRLKEELFFFVYKRVIGYTEFLAFISIFLLHIKKNVYLCNTFSAHQRDEIGGRRY